MVGYHAGSRRPSRVDAVRRLKLAGLSERLTSAAAAAAGPERGGLISAAKRRRQQRGQRKRRKRAQYRLRQFGRLQPRLLQAWAATTWVWPAWAPQRSAANTSNNVGWEYGQQQCRHPGSPAARQIRFGGCARASIGLFQLRRRKRRVVQLGHRQFRHPETAAPEASASATQAHQHRLVQHRRRQRSGFNPGS